MTSTIIEQELDLTILEDMEFAPVCEYIRKPLIWNYPCAAKAEWVYVPLKPSECGCLQPNRFFCDDCKNLREKNWLLSCTLCGEVGNKNNLTEFRFERISGGA